MSEPSSQDRDESAPDGSAAPDWRGHVWTLVLVVIATGVGVLLREQLGAPDLVIVYLFVIGIAAALFGRGPSVTASALSVLAYNFFFVPPHYTLEVDDERNLLTFAMLFVVGLSTSALTTRIRRQAEDARARETRTATLYALSRDLASGPDEDRIALALAQHAAEAFGGGAVVFLPAEDGSIVPKASSGASPPLDVDVADAARWAFDHGRVAGIGTHVRLSARTVCVPLRSGLTLTSLGVLAVEPKAVVPPEQRPLLESLARQGALALERARLAELAKTATLRARTEEMRSSLLSAVSHDLRTPLGAITGAATTLREGWRAMNEAQRTELLATVCEEAEGLDRLVGNLLDMTRLESGTIRVKREWVSVEEIVGSALHRLDEQLAGRSIRVEVPADLPLVSGDPVLLEQALIHLIENARKHTPEGSPIEITARNAGGATTIDVADRGPGLEPGSEFRVFDKFVRGKAAANAGAGLGLAICRGIAEAHGGTASAENRDGGGAVFHIALPRSGEAPPVPADPETEDLHEGRPS